MSASIATLYVLVAAWSGGVAVMSQVVAALSVEGAALSVRNETPRRMVFSRVLEFQILRLNANYRANAKTLKSGNAEMNFARFVSVLQPLFYNTGPALFGSLLCANQISYRC